MNGFGNALSFKDLDETDIETVEAFVRNELLKILSENASESIGGDCDALLDEQQMLDSFGEAYKDQPANFKFLNGHRKLIINVAAHVKQLVDGKGINKGLKLFQPKLIQSKRAIKSGAKIHTTQDATKPFVLDEKTLIEQLPQLKSSLFTKVMECLKQYKADQQVNLDTVDERIVSVTIEDGQVCGYIHCVICQNKQEKTRKRNKQQPKKVSYHVDESSQFWIPSNFNTHLRNVHKLIAEKPKPKADSKVDFNNRHENSIEGDINLDESVQMVSARNVSFPHLEFQEIYDQISTQITTMSKAVLDNNENENEMAILLSPGKFTNIKTVAAASDGNCLFQALSHQLYKYKMDSNEMKKSIKDLRAQAVTQIKTNMDRYQHELKGHAYELIDKKKETGEYSDSISIDIDKEVQFLVYQLLPRNRFWGGTETLKAVSDLHKVSIFVFVENQTFNVFTDERAKYERSIAIGFRNRNHFDSITDIAANDICTLFAAE